jgi:multidrug efflux pump subunit AcrB
VIGMISAVFVDRPRLAIVIAFVMTIAGLLALTQIPVAQFPDIVPPQVTVSATFPGASASVVEASVAQPLEAQVVGVDKMLYMKSTSLNDGSYTLTTSFALGTNPDINTVNVNNRVQAALAQLPPEVQLQGVTVQKKSSAILQFILLYIATPVPRTRCSSPTTLWSTSWMRSRGPLASVRPHCSRR